VFESKSHYHNSNQQIFQGDRIKWSLFCNRRNCTTYSSIQIFICETILLVWFISN